jgi:hypothetical protein
LAAFTRDPTHSRRAAELADLLVGFAKNADDGLGISEAPDVVTPDSGTEIGSDA